MSNKLVNQLRNTLFICSFASNSSLRLAPHHLRVDGSDLIRKMRHLMGFTEAKKVGQIEIMIMNYIQLSF